MFLQLITCHCNLTQLPPERRNACLKGMLAALTQQIAETEARQGELDPVEKRRTELALILQRARQNWLCLELGL